MNKKTRVVAVRMSEELYEKLRINAASRQRSLSQVLRLLLEAYFDETTPQNSEQSRRKYDRPSLKFRLEKPSAPH